MGQERQERGGSEPASVMWSWAVFGGRSDEGGCRGRGQGCLWRGLITFRQEIVGGADAGWTGLDPYDESVTLRTLLGRRDRANCSGEIERPEDGCSGS